MNSWTHKALYAATLMALAAMSAPSAQAADISNVQTTLGNLTYRLVDLNPNDGIAPAILWQSGGLQGTTYSGGDSFPYPEVRIADYPNYAYNTGTITTAPSVFNNTGTIALQDPRAGTSGSITGNRLSTQASLNSGLIDASVSQSGPYSYSYTTSEYNAATNTVDTYNVTNSSTSQSSQGTSFARIESTQAYLALTPNTMLVIEGDASASGTVSANDAKARGDAFQSQFGGNTTYFSNGIYGAAYGSSSVKLTFDNASLPFELYDSNGNLVVVQPTSSMTNGGSSYAAQSDSYDMSVSATYNSDGQMYLGGGGFVDPSFALVPDANGNASFSDGEHFSVALTNFTGQSRIAILDLHTFAAANQYQNSNAYSATRELISSVPYVDTPVTPGIPEPSTYALMGLGLAGVALAARRRQRPTPQA